MGRNSKIFLLIFFSVAIIIIAVAFFKFYVLKDFYIKLEVPCDPKTEKCFITECDPSSDSQCPGNPDERINYYKLVNKKASAVAICDSSDPDCPPIVCSAGEDCQEILCDESTKTKDEECSNPEEYLKNKKETEDNSESGN